MFAENIKKNIEKALKELDIKPGLFKLRNLTPDKVLKY